MDWRASPSNIAAIHDYVVAANDKASRQEAETLEAKMRAAIKAHRPFVRSGETPKPNHAPLPPNPVKGKVYFLTDRACASACLDFADLMRRLPGVTQIGLPTYADSVYMDIDSKLLPSRLARLGYAMKVFRHRARKNNQWYEPQIRWPGGPMNDDHAIVRWIKSLPKNHRSQAATSPVR